jgi:glycine betaine/proline transport system ATP-binding protein
MKTIRVNNLVKIFGKSIPAALKLMEAGKTKPEILEKTGCTVAIHDATFDVHEGEIFVIMGLSGSGKSTVIRCLNRLIEPTEGDVFIDNENVVSMNPEQLRQVRRSKLSMVFQHFGLLPHRTVLDNVEFGLEISGEKKDVRAGKARKAIASVGLEGYEDSLPDALSGGMQQRVGLARALANDPKVLLMDEAFSALDPLIRNQMQDELLELHSRVKKTIVFITHDLDEALKLGDRIAIMKDGAIVQIGSPEEILTAPRDDYVRAFIQNVDRTKVISAGNIMRYTPALISPKDGPRVAARMMEQQGLSSLFVVNPERELMGILSIDDAIELEKQNQKVVDERVRRDDIFVTRDDVPIRQLLSSALSARYPLAVLNEESKFCGILDRATIMNEVLAVSDEHNGAVQLETLPREKTASPAEEAKEKHDEN